MIRQFRGQSVFYAALLLLAPFASVARETIDYQNLSLTQSAQLIREGKIRSQDLVAAAIRRAEAERELNAFITLDGKRALGAAKAADAARTKGTRLGALHGVPIVIKDNIHVAGLPNTAGTPALRSFMPRENAPVVQALIDAGAIVLGKANMHELPSLTEPRDSGCRDAEEPHDDDHHHRL